MALKYQMEMYTWQLFYMLTWQCKQHLWGAIFIWNCCVAVQELDPKTTPTFTYTQTAFYARCLWKENLHFKQVKFLNFSKHVSDTKNSTCQKTHRHLGLAIVLYKIQLVTRKSTDFSMHFFESLPRNVTSSVSEGLLYLWPLLH